ncbi:hypothetical protein BJV74DRAFT_854653 [Russula compacta]|nr:hypothetical protein BJV74DRAFT_854653 [Russula compacta]
MTGMYERGEGSRMVAIATPALSLRSEDKWVLLVCGFGGGHNYDPGMMAGRLYGNATTHVASPSSSDMSRKVLQEPAVNRRFMDPPEIVQVSWSGREK